MLENIESSDVLFFVLTTTILVGILASVSRCIIKQRINRQTEVIMRTIEHGVEEVGDLQRALIDSEQQLALERERHEKIKQAFDEEARSQVTSRNAIDVRSHSSVAGIGECGDTLFFRQPLSEQLRVLESQVVLAEELSTRFNISADQLMLDQDELSKKIEKRTR